MVSGPALLIAIGVALAWFAGAETIHGAKIVGHKVKQGGTAVVHVLKKIPHPHHEEGK